ncbi:MAG: hypothetical protein SGPRY_004083, partial [Prymnesium sp.]
MEACSSPQRKAHRLMEAAVLLNQIHPSPPKRAREEETGLEQLGHPFLQGFDDAALLRFMEDRAICKLFHDRAAPHAFFGVFDGHGGAEASEFCAEHLHDNIINSQHFPDIIPALKDGFLRTDADFLTLAETATCKKVTESGSAAVTLLVTLEQLSVACAGDCRALLIKRDGTHVDLSTDHTAELHENSCVPLRPDEAERVSSTGGVMDHGVVWVGDNSLPMTRAVGDMHLKVAEGRNWHSSPADHQVVTALPEVQTCDRSANDLCVVLASDGVFGSVMSSAQVASLTMHELQQHRGLQDAEKRAAMALADSAYGQHH